MKRRRLTVLNFLVALQAAWNGARPAPAPPPPSPRARPGGFTVLAIGLGLFVVGQVSDIVGSPAGPLSWPVVVSLVATGLAAVAVEALWKVRPWATRACGALALLAMGAYFALAIAYHAGIAAVFPAIIIAIFLACVVRYVDSHVQAVHGPTVILQVRRPVPGPWTRWRP